MGESDDITQYLQLMSELFSGHTMGFKSKDGYRYRCVPDLLLKEGVLFKDIRDPAGSNEQSACKAKACYLNCFTLAAEEPDRYIYCEGYGVLASLGLPLPHAWVYDKTDKAVVDPTWAAAGNTGPDDIYLGIPFRLNYVAQSMVVAGCLLDNYEQRHPILKDKPYKYMHNHFRSATSIYPSEGA